MRYHRAAAFVGAIVGVVLLAIFCRWGEVVRAADAPAAQSDSEQEFHDKIVPMLAQNCYACHGNGNHEGNLALDSFKSAADVQAHAKQWESVLKALRGGFMPPLTAKHFPSFQERNAAADWIRSQLSAYSLAHPDPGLAAIHRLTRAEYRNTIRDLVGVDFKPADTFPEDEATGRGTPPGTAPALTPELKEKYLEAAGRIIDEAVVMNADLSQPASKMPPALAADFTVQPTATTKTGAAREILGNFARQAWRRPVEPAELDRLTGLFETADNKGLSFQEAIKAPMETVLVSPDFLFRGAIQPQPGSSESLHPVSEYELASRLSYFIWSSMPDGELFGLAEHQQLRPQLIAQVKRMLASPKAQALADNFCDQWLLTKDLETATKDKDVFPEYDADLRDSMKTETHLFFNAVRQEDRSVMDFLNGNYTFLNQRLSEFYGIGGIKGELFRRVSLQGTPRRGVLTQGGVLIVANYWYHNRTSVTARGKWVMMNLLNIPGSTPLGGAPPLPNVGHPNSGTLRQQMEQHRASVACFYCHVQIDPLGFALESFDGIGKWRDKEGSDPADASGQLPTGETFNGAAQMLNILAENHQDQFLDCIATKMLGYALGRPAEASDQPAVDQIVQAMKKNDLKFSSLVMGVVNSMPFQMHRDESPIAAAPIVH